MRKWGKHNKLILTWPTPGWWAILFANTDILVEELLSNLDDVF